MKLTEIHKVLPLKICYDTENKFQRTKQHLSSSLVASTITQTPPTIFSNQSFNEKRYLGKCQLFNEQGHFVHRCSTYRWRFEPSCSPPNQNNPPQANYSALPNLFTSSWLLYTGTSTM